ncbi:MAG: YebC/PmpR family DNA-binding transcriptional regulator [Steroidobacteraceae bacterium]
MHSVRYEGYGPGDSAVMVDCRTPDRDRAAAAVRAALASHGGYLGAQGSVGYLFREVGRLEYGSAAALASHTELAWEAGAEDVAVRPDGSVELLTDPSELGAVRARLGLAGCEARASKVTYRACVTVQLAAAEAARMARLLRALESLEDVRSVYTNAEVAGELLESI